MEERTFWKLKARCSKKCSDGMRITSGDSLKMGRHSQGRWLSVWMGKIKGNILLSLCPPLTDGTAKSRYCLGASLLTPLMLLPARVASRSFVQVEPVMAAISFRSRRPRCSSRNNKLAKFSHGCSSKWSSSWINVWKFYYFALFFSAKTHNCGCPRENVCLGVFVRNFGGRRGETAIQRQQKWGGGRQPI